MSGMISSWANSWNEIIRSVLFPDRTLKRLMLLPNDINIIDFIERYFIRAGYTSRLLKDERVRIVYSDILGEPTPSHKVIKNEMVFDIYVKLDDLHNVSNDRLKLRTYEIADRILTLLTQERYLYGYRFWVNGDYDLGTRTIGYARHCLSIGYMKVY